MKVFRSLRNCKLRPDQVADIIESYVLGMKINEIADRHRAPSATIENYIYRHYHGIVPKENQIRITLKSKV